MFRRRSERVDAWDAHPSKKTVADVDEQTLRDYVRRGNACGRISFPYTNVREVLDSLGLLRDGHLTNTADVLFCKSPIIRLRQGVIENHARTEILDLQQESGTVFDLVHKADLYVLNNTRRRFVIDGAGPRREIPEIPRAAIREAMFNAYCHMDWSQWDCVIVDIYYDSIEILSPGWFIEGQDPEEHLAGKSRSPLTRNQNLAQALYKCRAIETYGTGIPRMRDLCAAAGVELEYKRTPDGTLLIFYRNDAFAHLGQSGPSSHSGGTLETLNETINGDETINETINRPLDRFVELDRDELIVLGYLSTHPRATYEEVSKATDFSRAKVGRIISELRGSNVLIREGSRKRGAWRVIP